MLVFPEEALTGAIHCDDCEHLGGPCDLHRSLAETVPGPSTEALAGLAAEHDLYVVVGMIEQDPGDPDALYNAAAVIGPEGVIGTYRKLHLGSLPFVTEGSRFGLAPAWTSSKPATGPSGCRSATTSGSTPRAAACWRSKEPGSSSTPPRHSRAGRTKWSRCAGWPLPGGRRTSYLPSRPTRWAASTLATASRTASTERCPPTTPATASSAAPDFPDFSHIYAEGTDAEGLVIADLDFEVLHRWDDVCPWRQWRATHQSGTSELFATEFAKLVHGPPAS